MKYLMLIALASASLTGCSTAPKIEDPRFEYPRAPEALMKPPLKLKPIVVPVTEPDENQQK